MTPSAHFPPLSFPFSRLTDSLCNIPFVVLPPLSDSSSHSIIFRFTSSNYNHTFPLSFTYFYTSFHLTLQFLQCPISLQLQSPLFFFVPFDIVLRFCLRGSASSRSNVLLIWSLLIVFLLHHFVALSPFFTFKISVYGAPSVIPFRLSQILIPGSSFRLSFPSLP